MYRFLPLLLFSILLAAGSISFSQNLESEPNNAFQTANQLTLSNNSVTIQGAISPNGDNDYYAVDIPRAGVFKVRVNNVPGAYEVGVQVFNSSQSLVEDFRTGNYGGSLNKRHLECYAGTYYFRVYARSGSWSNQQYSFILDFDTTDVYECNNNFQNASPIPLNGTIHAAINANGDQDYFKVETSRAGVFDLSITNVSAAYEVGVQIFDSGQNEIKAFRAGAYGTSLSPRHLVCNAGTYYFRIYARSGSSGSQLYNFTLNFDTTDVYECNNNIQSAASIPLNGTIQAALNADGDKDFFKVVAPRAGAFDIGVVNVPGAYELGLKIYDSGQNIIHDSRAGNYGAAVYRRIFVCDSGTYYFHLYARSGSSSRNLYNLTLRFDDEDVYECNNNFFDATPMNVCDSIYGSIGINGDKDYYSFQAGANQSVQFSLFNVSPDITPRVTFFDLFQNQVATFTANAGQPMQHSFQTTTAGKYYAELGDNGNNDFDTILYEFVVDTNCLSVSRDQPVHGPTFELYPNPSEGEVRVGFESGLPQPGVLHIQNAWGQVVLSQEVFGGKTLLSLEGLPAGMYLVGVEVAGVRRWKRLVVR